MAKKKEQELENIQEEESSVSSILEELRKKCEKEYGVNALVKMGDKSSFQKVDFLPLDIAGLDYALGGGFGKSRIIEIYGPESSGKTTLCLHAIVAGQKFGPCAFIDTEHAFDPVYAKNVGVDLENLWLSQPDNGEQALNIVEDMIDTKVYSIIIIDSVAALTPQAEIEGEMGDAQIGLQARLMSKALRKLTAKLGKSKTVLIFTNQIRMKIGVMFGNPEVTTAGNSLKFYASQRIEMRKKETNEEGGEAISNTVKIKVVKNKLAPPFRATEEIIEFGKGISKYVSLANLAVKKDVVVRKGAWFSYGEERLGQGINSVYDWLEDNPDKFNEVYTKVLQREETAGEKIIIDKEDVIDEQEQ